MQVVDEAVKANLHHQKFNDYDIKTKNDLERVIMRQCKSTKGALQVRMGKFLTKVHSDIRGRGGGWGGVQI